MYGFPNNLGKIRKNCRHQVRREIPWRKPALCHHLQGWKKSVMYE